MYAGYTCDKCKNPKMQFPGCHTLKSNELESETSMKSIANYAKFRDEHLRQKCKDAIPPTLDTFDQLRYNGEISLSGLYSLSEINKEIGLFSLNEGNRDYTKCLAGRNGSNLRIYLELIEESYVNKRIPITVLDIVDKEEKVLAESTPLYFPGRDDKIIKGEFIEIDLSNDFANDKDLLRVINFNLDELLNMGTNNLKIECMRVYLEISLISKDSLNFNGEKCSKDHDNPLIDDQFANKDVLKIKPGFDYSSIVDPKTLKFNEKSFVYEDSDGEFFHQKDIELVDDKIQNLDIELLQNFQSSSHMLGMIIEAPLEGNHEAFMHGDSKPN